MISVKEAVQAAAVFAQNVLGGVIEPGSIIWHDNVRLEEVERGEFSGSDAWLITLSAPDPDALPFPVDKRTRRVYKTFTVDGTSGEVLSMKIRELAGA